MQDSHRMARRLVCALLALACLGAAGLLAGCGGTGGSDSAQRSEELTPGEFPDERPPAPVQPPPPQLRKPETAVYSYLLWISYAYRVADSQVARQAFSDSEEVRVNSYVELNRQKGRAIDQRLIGFEVRSVESEGDTATVSASETWRYRYIDIESGAYQGGANDATFESVYTVVRKAEHRWLVDKVEVRPTSGTVK